MSQQMTGPPAGSAEEITNRFKYYPADTEERRRAHQAIRDQAAQIAVLWHGSLPPGRERATALTKLEEAMFWANAAIARNGPPA